MAENRRVMTPTEFWLAAAAWGSYMNDWDPGACMYGFDEHGTVQNEGHRADCIAHLNGPCRENAKHNPPEDNNIDDLIAYLRTAPSYTKAELDVDDGPFNGYRRGGRAVMKAEYDAMQAQHRQELQTLHDRDAPETEVKTLLNKQEAERLGCG